MSGTVYNSSQELGTLMTEVHKKKFLLICCSVFFLVCFGWLFSWMFVWLVWFGWI